MSSGLTDRLIDDVCMWAEDKGILANGSLAGQYKKHVEEVGELGEALILQNRDKFLDAIGDVMVTLIVLAALAEEDITECLNLALKEISGRTGTMVDGVFVKDAT